MTKYEFQNNSWIVSVEYDDNTKEMLVSTKSKQYALIGVPLEVYQTFESSSSRGAFFNDNLKGRYMDGLFK